MIRRVVATMRVLFGAIGFCVACVGHADTTTLTLSPASRGSSNIPVTLAFPVTRNGDTSYDAEFAYRTNDGSAVAGIDYTEASGVITIPAGSTSANIPVTIAANTTSNPTKTFQLLLDAATGIGPAPQFGAQRPFATGATPLAVSLADINGDGRPDVIVLNSGDSTVSVLLNTTTPGATTSSFTTQQTFGTGGLPGSLTVADINGDGKPDLIVGNDNSTYSVLLNTTALGAMTPSFATKQTFLSPGIHSMLVYAADINGDGKPDVVVANVTPTTIVSVLVNTTAPGSMTASFAAKQDFTAGMYPYSIATADVNGDGKPDLIVANANDDSVSVLLNTTLVGAGTLSFSTQPSCPVGMTPESVTITDVNGDGRPDLVVANTNSFNISVLLNATVPGAAASSFAAQQTFGTGGNPHSIAIADVNGDGKPDVVVANGSDNVSVLLNTSLPGASTPSFATHQTFAAEGAPLSVTTADINGDGKPDLVVANAGSNVTPGNNVSVLLNTTTLGATASRLAAQQTFASGVLPFSVTTADLNGDGNRDVVVANYSDYTVSVLLNNTEPGAIAPSLAAQQTFDTAPFPRSVAVDDINGDGVPDLIVACASDSVSVLLNTTMPGATTATFAGQQPFLTGSSPYSVAVADLNGDGKPDLIVTNHGDNTVSVLLNNTILGATTPAFATQQPFDVGSSPVAVAVGDMNGDGVPDLIVTNSGDDTVSILLNKTAPGAALLSFAAQQTFSTGSTPYGVAISDVSGDGMPDLIVTNKGDDTVSVLLSNTTPGATLLSFFAQQPFATGLMPYSVSDTDLNGDGKPDLIVANFGSGDVSVLFNTTSPGATLPTFDTQQTFSAGTNPTSATAADLNGDGKPDVIVTNASDGNVSVLLNTQYQTTIVGSPATGTIVHDYVFGNGFE